MLSHTITGDFEVSPNITENHQQSVCYQCFEPLAKFTNISTDVNGTERSFCCYGCLAAAEFIDKNDLTEFYLRRDQAKGKDMLLPKNGLRIDWSFLDEPQHNKEYVTETSNGDRQISVFIRGVYCSSCSWLIRKTLDNISDGITSQLDVSAKQLLLKVSDPDLRLSAVLKAIENIGYQVSATPIAGQLDDVDAQRKYENQQSLKRIAVAGFGMMQVMTYAVSIYFGDAQGMDDQFKQFLSLISLLVATVVVFYAGKHFFVNAWSDIKNRHLGMDVPIALAIAGAYLPSVYQTLIRTPLNIQGSIYFDSAVMFVFFLSVGRHVERRAQYRLTSAPVALTRMLPPMISVNRQLEGQLRTISVKPRDALPGDILELSNQQVVPFDGLVLSGEALLNESLITGEPNAVRRVVGDLLVAGSVLLNGSLRVQASHAYANSSLAKIEQLLKTAQLTQDPQSKNLQRVTQYFVTSVLIITFLVALFWWPVAPERVFGIVLAMLVASCPCAFSLAGPMAATAASRALRSKGLLLANFRALGIIPKISNWCFDKTGTITEGNPTISSLEVYAQVSAETCLDIAAAIESKNQHVLSPAFNRTTSSRVAKNLQHFAGQGVSAVIDGTRYFLGKPAWVYTLIKQPKLEKNTRSSGSHAASTVVALASDTSHLANFFIEDKLRPQAEFAIRALKARAVSISILSGDRLSVINSITNDLPVDYKRGDQLAIQKMEFVKTLQQQGEVVAMVGDGINDAPVIAQADVSLVMSSGSDVSASQADIVVLNGGLAGLDGLYDIASFTEKVTRQNLNWAIAYNMIALPMAASGLLTPWLAALGMSISSLFVVLNAVRISKMGGL